MEKELFDNIRELLRLKNICCNQVDICGINLYNDEIHIDDVRSTFPEGEETISYRGSVDYPIMVTKRIDGITFYSLYENEERKEEIEKNTGKREED